MANPTITKTSPSHTCDVFEQGCMFCANKDLTKFNPENYPQKVHVAEMTYHSPPGTLYIRETTAEVEKQVVDRPLDSTVGGTGIPETLSSTDEVIHFRGLKQSCSGITFIEEKEEEKREALYKKRIQSSIAKRRLWKAYCKHVENYRKMKQMEAVGPRWFQELSTTQTTLLESLPHILKSDTDEKTITSSKRFLSEMGIVPEIEPRYLEKAVIDCELDPLYFLARIQSEIKYLIDKKLEPVSQISNFKMKKRKYTVSERIVLSSIAHLHMPVFLFKLHLILPPPALDKSETYNILAPLSESVKLPEPKKEWYKVDKSEIPSQENNEVIDEQDSSKNTTNTEDSKTIFNKVYETSSTATSVSVPLYRERKSQYYGMDKTKTKQIQATLHEQSSYQLHVEQNQSHQKIDDSSPSVTSSMRLIQNKDDEGDPNAIPSFQSFFQGIEGSDSTYFIIDSFTQTNVSFHDNIAVIVPENVHTKEYDSEVEKIEEEVAELLQFVKVPVQPPFGKVDVTSSSAQTEVGWLPAHVGTDVLQHLEDDYLYDGTKEGTVSVDKGAGTVNKDEIDLEEAIANLIASIIRKPTEQELQRRKKLKQCLEHNNIDGLYNIFGIEKHSQRKASSKVRGSSKTKYDSASKFVKKETLCKKSSSTIKLLENEELLESELENLVRKLQEEIKKKKLADQLQFAIKMLALAGDPLADFPDLTRHPVLRRWYEIRRGIKRKLSEKEKVRLMYNSKNVWRYLLNTTSELRSPRCNLTIEQLTEFTWDKRQWLRRKEKKLSNQFHRDIQQSLVDDARILYPSMNTDYYSSKLNKNIRKVFFTYLPAKENDYYVVRPQKPEEMQKKEIK